MVCVLVVKTGTTLPQVAARRGDFEDWIRSGMGLGEDEMEVAEVQRGDSLPEPAACPAIVVTGSAALVSQREPWSERTASWLARVVETGAPILGICYGHQLLAQALGGVVGANPRGREIGTVEVDLAEARGDRLLGDFAYRVRVQESHVESVLELPAGARVLGSNERDRHQAFAVGETAWGVQFHPEFDADVIRGYIDGRRDLLESEGLDPDALRTAASDAPEGRALLRRFA